MMDFDPLVFCRGIPINNCTLIVSRKLACFDDELSQL